jgi:hypothetical protein
MNPTFKLKQESTMKNIFLVSLTFLFLPVCHINAQKTTPSKISAPFQGLKKFCSYTHRSTYTITIKGINTEILYSYNDDTTIIKGTFRNGKLYTNDSDEKKNKNLAGKYYQLTTNAFRILNAESGDYDEYHVCD